MRAAPLLAIGLTGLAACADDTIARVFPGITVRPESLTLEATPVGSAKSYTIEVVSSGTAPLEVQSIALSDDMRSPDLGTRVDVPLPTQLAPSGTLMFTVQHVPRDGVADEGVIRVTSNDDSKRVVEIPIHDPRMGAPEIAAVPDFDRALQESGTGGGISTFSTRVDLGNVALGTRKTVEVFLINAGSGNVALQPESVMVIGGGTSLRVSSTPEIGGAQPIYLPPLATSSPNATRSVRLQVTWEPVARGMDLSATIRVHSNDPMTADFDLPVVGTTDGALPPVLRLEPAAGLDFGTVGVSTRTESRFNAINDGQGTLTIEPLAISTNPDNVFTLVGMQQQVMLTAGQSHTFTVAFRPASAMMYQGAVRVVSNDPMRSPIDYVLRGRGGAAPMMCMPNPPRPNEPANNMCPTAVDRGRMLLMNNQTSRAGPFTDSVLEASSDSDWNKVTVSVSDGCDFVGYELIATLMVPTGEQAEVCMFVGDCTSPDSMNCGAGRARVFEILGQSLCEAHNNELPVYIQVRQTGGNPTCMPYTLSFSAR